MIDTKTITAKEKKIGEAKTNSITSITQGNAQSICPYKSLSSAIIETPQSSPRQNISHALYDDHNDYKAPKGTASRLKN